MPSPPNAAHRADAPDDADAEDAAQPPNTITTLGLTGSIGMGKSAVASMLSRLQVPVLDADAVVHSLYAPSGAAVAPIAAAFGDATLTAEGGVCRQSLSRVVLNDGDAMRALEAIVHPLVALERTSFLNECASDGLQLAALDIPLLFETGAENTVDAVAVVSAPPQQQRARVLARPGMTEAKFEAILARQVPDAEKRARADFVLDTGAAMPETERAVAALVRVLRRGEALVAGVGGQAGDGGGFWPHPEAEALLVVREWRLEEARARRRR